MPTTHRLLSLVACLAFLLPSACAQPDTQTFTTTAAEPAAASPPSTADTSPAEPSPDPHERPDWLGTRPLRLDKDGFGEVLPTPAELVDRQLRPPAPQADPAPRGFIGTTTPAPTDVLSRSTWHDGCPVNANDLAYLQVTYLGFDDLPHAGELLVHVEVADDVLRVFEILYGASFPIEEMRIVTNADLDAAPTGDGNNTTSFVCRAARSSGRWSEHAYGKAVDINPFHNPYLKGDVVLPELASAYLDRDDVRPGMIFDGDAATQTFDALGWGWGGRWSSLTDWMHFSVGGT